MRNYSLSFAFLLSSTAALIQFPAQAAQSFTCTGQMDNGFGYTAQYVNGRFTQIVWDRPGQPPTTSQLTYDRVNPEGKPVYRGSFLAATAVTLVDLSGGDVRSGSQISVGVEEWGWSRGTCTTEGGGLPPSQKQFTCTGQMENGFGYSAQYVDDRFTQIVWDRPGQPPTTSQLTYDRVNPEGKPVYRGSFLAATAVTLVDLSGGDVRSGSQISVGVEEWGWSRGTCR